MRFRRSWLRATEPKSPLTSSARSSMKSWPRPSRGRAALNMQLRKIIKTRGHSPSDEAAVKLLWLALRNLLAKSVRTTYDWKSAMNQFAILYGERFTAARGVTELKTTSHTKMRTGPPKGANTSSVNRQDGCARQDSKVPKE
ncbi:hypothetical protein CBM2626_A10114 [Cupriavidus taiwanensis]|nr:hypothetical protein CBM2626_A10114 [Cupriavidus taiwanensis]